MKAEPVSIRERWRWLEMPFPPASTLKVEGQQAAVRPGWSGVQRIDRLFLAALQPPAAANFSKPVSPSANA